MQFSVAASLRSVEDYFYGDTPAGLEDAVARILRKYPSYEVGVGSEQQPDWDQYHSLLYPSEDQLESIANRDVLDVMSKDGDDHEIPSDVDHFMYFPDTESRTAFIAAVRASSVKGRIAELAEGSADRGWGVTVTSVHSVTPDQIDRHTKSLRILAVQVGGEYDGWGATVMTETSNSEQ